MHLLPILKNFISIPALLASICLAQWPTNAYAADFGSSPKGIGYVIQNITNGLKDISSIDNEKKAEQRFYQIAQQQPYQGIDYIRSPRTGSGSDKEQIAREARARNSIKATKIPPSSSNWIKIDKEWGITFYIDPALIRQSGLFVTIPYLVDLPVSNEINLIESRHPYKSVISVIQYDCSRSSLPPRSERFWSTEDHFFFPENMAQGDPMMDPARRKEPIWIAGMDERGFPYENSPRQVSQSYFVVKVLNPELKICRNYWKAPEGWEPPKTPPYLQKTTALTCEGADLSTSNHPYCMAVLNKSLHPVWEGRNLIFKTPGRYEGPVDTGYPAGWGKYTFEGGDRAGDVYIGFFDLGNFEGFGTYYHNSLNNLKGSKYIGHFSKNLREGLGSYIFADGRREEGIWKKDRLFKPMSINTFFLDTRKELPTCQGTDATQWTDCFGYFEFDSIQGQSLKRGPDTAYAGGFKNGMPDGVGSYFSRNRQTVRDQILYYQGEIKQGKYEGTGTWFDDLSGENYYSGGFVNDKRQGTGVNQRVRNQMERYEGDWMNDFFVKGTVYKEKQFTYVGSLKAGKFHGEGILTPVRLPGEEEPVVKQGVWKDGQLLDPKKTIKK